MSSTLKRIRNRKVESESDPEFQVAPMVDVLLVLLLFFMSITSTEILKKEKNLHLPDAKNAKEKKEKINSNEIVVNVTWDKDTQLAAYSVDGTHYASASDLQGMLQTRASANPNAYVLIRADKAVTYSNISDVMNTCSGSGISTVTFGVITGGNKSPSGSSQSGN